MRAFLLLAVVLGVAWPSTAFAQNQPWHLDIWGVSYHVNRDAGYEELNWGLGIRRDSRPAWRWLGKSDDNRVFVEADALRDSNRGLALPLSAGVEYRVATLPRGCKVFAAGTFTLAYYQFPDQGRSEIKAGPVPAFAIGCGRVRANMLVVFRKDAEPVAAVSAFVSVAF